MAQVKNIENQHNKNVQLSDLGKKHGMAHICLNVI